MRIAFLGSGTSARALVQNLLASGHRVAVHDGPPPTGLARPPKGAQATASLAETVGRAEVVITLLHEGSAVEDLIYGSGGLIQHLPAKCIHLCMGGIDVESSARLASMHGKAGQGYVAAPLVGSERVVAACGAWILAGGAERHVNRCMPIFLALGRGLTRVGPRAPLAHALKLGGDALNKAMEQALAGLVAACERIALPPEDYLRLLNAEIFRSPLQPGFGGVLVDARSDPSELTLDSAATELLLGLGPSREAVSGASEASRAPVTPGWREEAFQPAIQVAASQVVPEPEALPELPPTPDPSPSLPETESGGPTHPDPQAALRPESVLSGLPLPQLEAEASADPGRTRPLGPSTPYAAQDGAEALTLELERTSHFELVRGRVQAWSEGRCYGTAWRSLSDVALTFNHVLLLPIQRHILLRPEAALDLRPTFGGGAKVRVGEGLELPVSRAMAPRLKEVLGW